MIPSMVVSRRSAALVVLAMIGCGDHSGSATSDASDAAIDSSVSSCAFDPPSTPTGGVVNLGTGENSFVPVTANENFPTYLGPQGAYYIWINVRIQGLDLGDGTDVMSRPQTKFSVFTPDGTRVNLETCGYRLPYQDGGDGYMYLSMSWLSMFLPTFGESIDNNPIQLQVEVLDRDGLYAIDQRSVIALAPTPASP